MYFHRLKKAIKFIYICGDLFIFVVIVVVFNLEKFKYSLGHRSIVIN